MTVEAGYFDADIAETGRDGVPLAREDTAVGRIGADAEGGGLGEKHFVELGFVLGLAEESDEHAGAAFFHLDGGGEDVEGTGGECFVEEVAKDLRVHVVEIGFEDADGFLFAGKFLCERFAEHDAEDVGLGIEVGGACAIADGADGEGG